MRVTIGELCDAGEATIQTGPFGSQLHAHEYVEAGVPIVPTSAIGRRLLIEDGLPRISEEKAFELNRHCLLPGDILFARRGVQATGLSAIVKEYQRGWICGTGAIRLRVEHQTIDPEFLSFFLSTDCMYSWLQQHAVGATMPNLNEDVLRQITLQIPSLPEQRRIAAVLGALDDKIELNRRMNRTLEEMAQAIFRSWFVDFDGQAEFADSGTELGEVPKGWVVKPLDKVAHFLNGAACQKYPPQANEEGLPVIKIRELRSGFSERTERASCSVPERYIIEDGDVLFSWSGSLLVRIWSGGRGLLNQHLFKVTSKQYPKWFFYLWVQHYLNQFQRIAESKATTMGHIKRHHLSDALVVVPPDPVLQESGQTFEPLFVRQLANELQSRTLAELRDTLLPKLISGEIRVGEAETMLDDTV